MPRHALPKHRVVEIEFPSLYQKQRDAIFSPLRYSLIESGTKTGKTLGCAIWMNSKVLSEDRKGDISWWVAPTYEQARLGYDRMRELLPADFAKFSESRLSIEFPNGAEVLCKSGEKPDNLFGAAVKRGVIDEASRLRPESWNAFRTTLTQTKGPVRVIGNPKGRKTWFWRWCQRVKNGEDPEAAYFHLRSVDNPFISKEEIETARRDLPPSVFEELYEGVASDEGTEVFRHIRECLDPNCLGPPIAGRPYVAGLDLARLKDYTVLLIMDGITRHVRLLMRVNVLDWDIQIARIVSLLKEYNNAFVMMDATAMGGDVILNNLLKQYQNVYPFKFTNESKKNLVSQLSISFDQKRIRIPPDKYLISELETFDYELLPSGAVRYAAPEGLHDDMVWSLALANLLAEQMGFTQVKVPKTLLEQVQELSNDFNGAQIIPVGADYRAALELERMSNRPRNNFTRNWVYF